MQAESLDQFMPILTAKLRRLTETAGAPTPPAGDQPKEA
jgi:hypothetical protein